ncbi:MAG TPA: TlyA family RNA methyltransferase [Pseudonocardiaceae bacterium]|nr:TlyA family RNA methyltransferase [Pseudonocardiaceae bacterium]
MVRRARLDAELVRRGLARSRDHAAELVAQRRVQIHGVTATKPATGVDADTPLLVQAKDEEPEWVSRGARKLLGALDSLVTGGPVVADRRCLDAGASTGGFTEVLLVRGAREVVAVDVGYGQLAWSLRTDQRVRVRDRTNVRTLQPADIGGTADLTVADLSFISLRLVLPALLRCTSPDGDLLPMVKPQFEVGRERLGAGGVVRDPVLREQAVLDVVAAAANLGLCLIDATASPLPGPAGNVEYFLWLRRERTGPWRCAEDVVRVAVQEGPQ